MICVLRKVLKEFWNAECLPILCPFGGLSVTVAVAKQSWLGLSLSGWDRGEACAHISCSHKPCSPCPVSSSDHLVRSTGKSSIRLQSSTEDASQRCLASDFLCFHAEWPCTAVEKTAAETLDSHTTWEACCPPPIPFVTIVMATCICLTLCTLMPRLSDRQPPGYQENYIIGT